MNQLDAVGRMDAAGTSSTGQSPGQQQQGNGGSAFMGAPASGSGMM